MNTLQKIEYIFNLLNQQSSILSGDTIVYQPLISDKSEYIDELMSLKDSADITDKYSFYNRLISLKNTVRIGLMNYSIDALTDEQKAVIINELKTLLLS